MTVMSFSLMRLAGPAARRPGKKCNSSERHSLPSNTVHYTVNIVHSQTQQPGGDHGEPAAGSADAGQHALWFSPPDGEESRRRALTRERVVAEALAVIAADGAGALSMRALAARLGVVPGALYRHVRSKEQLCDLAVDGVLAEVDTQAGPALGWAEQVKVLARRLRAVLEDHPGIAALLKTRDPLGPHSLALAEAFLAALQEAGLPDAGDRPGVLPGLRLHPRLRAQRPHHRQRAARPGHRDQAPAARVLPVTASRPVPGPGCPRRARLGRQPRPAIHRRPRHPPRRHRNSAAP